MKRLALLTTAALLGACSSTPPPPPPQAGTAEFAVLQSQQRHEALITQVKATASEIPDWYVNPPKDEHALYAAGTAYSSDLEFAFDKAILSAKRALADRVNGAVSAQHKEYLQEGSANAVPMQVSERATTNKITDVVLNGYTVVQTKLVPSDTQYRAFVLLQYPLANMAPTQTKQADNEPTQDFKVKAAKAFDELQKNIDAQKQKDADAQKQRDIDAANARNDVQQADLPALPQ
jgi:hypothetical protein